jgi:hypothetical protein
MTSSDDIIFCDEDDDNDDLLFVVAVDSRGKSLSDLGCYKECTCSKPFFHEHMINNSHHECVASPVAAMCGMDLKLFFYDHINDDVLPLFGPNSDGSSVEREINAVATFLTFDPETGDTYHKIYGKAYVVWNNGQSALSKRQCWGLNKLILQARQQYHKEGEDHLKNAKLELFRWCQQYQLGLWTPRAIYESRHEHEQRHYPSLHHAHHAHPHDFRHHLRHRHHHLDRELSGISDQATCHHGCTHVHHEGHHACCHHSKNLFTDDCDSDKCHSDDQVNRTHVVIQDSPHNPRKLDSELFVFI